MEYVMFGVSAMIAGVIAAVCGFVLGIDYEQKRQMKAKKDVKEPRFLNV